MDNATLFLRMNLFKKKKIGPKGRVRWQYLHFYDMKTQCKIAVQDCSTSMQYKSAVKVSCTSLKINIAVQDYNTIL